MGKNVGPIWIIVTILLNVKQSLQYSSTPDTFTLMKNHLFDTTDDLSSILDVEEPCYFNEKNGFHTPDPIYIATEVHNIQECVILCLYTKLCLSGNFIEKTNQYAICLLHSSNVLNADSLESAINSVYFEFTCHFKPKILTRVVNNLPTPSQCGLAAFNTEADDDPAISLNRRKRIVDGFPTRFYSQPWLGWVLDDGEHVCGASLIATGPMETSTIWAISAAHCFDGRLRGFWKSLHLDQYKFVFGGQDVRVFTPHTIVRFPRSIYRHNSFKITSTIYDIALIKFTEEIRFSAFISPICLPNVGLVYELLLEAATCHACGLGFTRSKPPFEAADMSDRANRLKCVVTEARILGPPNLLVQRQTNQIYYGTSIGDSGGPNACKFNNSGPYVLLGVINGVIYSEFYHKYYGLYLYYTYYAFVPAYMNWINRLFRTKRSNGSELTCVGCLSNAKA